MQLYLIRHAHALDLADDDARPLSERGHGQVRLVAAFLRQSRGFAPREFWHSPLVRARETAVGLAAKIAAAGRLIETDGLRPEDDPAALVRRLRAGPESLALVGHEPFMSALASLLVAGDATRPVFLFEKCAVLALEGAADYWAVRWHIAPALLGGEA